MPSRVLLAYFILLQSNFINFITDNLGHYYYDSCNQAMMDMITHPHHHDGQDGANPRKSFFPIIVFRVSPTLDNERFALVLSLSLLFFVRLLMKMLFPLTMLTDSIISSPRPLS
jgi:hypothetical protein